MHNMLCQVCQFEPLIWKAGDCTNEWRQVGQVSKGLGKASHQLSDEFIVNVTDEFTERLQHFLYLTNRPQSSCLVKHLMCCIVSISMNYHFFSGNMPLFCLNWAHCYLLATLNNVLLPPMESRHWTILKLDLCTYSLDYGKSYSSDYRKNVLTRHTHIGGIMLYNHSKVCPILVFWGIFHHLKLRTEPCSMYSDIVLTSINTHTLILFGPERVITIVSLVLSLPHCCSPIPAAPVTHFFTIWFKGSPTLTLSHPHLISSFSRPDNLSPVLIPF